MNRRPSELNTEELQIITAMNDVYFAHRGRPDVKTIRMNSSHSRFAAEYFLQLLERKYIDPVSKCEKYLEIGSVWLKGFYPLIIHAAINAFVDFTEAGGQFLYRSDPNIPDEQLRDIALMLIEKIKDADFSARDSTAEYAFTAMTVLTGMNVSVLPSARGTWLEGHHISLERSGIPYDSDITNKILIPEAVEYAGMNVPFIK